MYFNRGLEKKMKSLSKFFTLAILLLNTTYVLGDEGLYVSGNLGIGIVLDSELKINSNVAATTQLDPGFAFTTALGYDFGNSIRAEVEVAYQQTKLKSRKIGDATTSITNRSADTTSLLANIYYDFKNSSDFTPYVGGGIGFTHIEVTPATDLPVPILFTDDVFAYQFGLGVDYAINHKMAIGVNYRYIGTTDREYPGNIAISAASNNIYVGMKYRF